MKATANFFYGDKFYKAGDDVPQDVVNNVGDHLFASPSEEPQKALKAPLESSPEGNPEGDDDKTSESVSKDREYFESLTKEALVDEAKAAGIGGRNTRDELIDKLVEHYG